MQHLMIDIETLDTKPTAVVLSVGACQFELETGEIGVQYNSGPLVINTQLQAGRTISENTLRWWMQAEQEAARASSFGSNVVHVSGALNALRDLADENTIVWGNDPAFDCVILEDLYRTMWSCEAPWKFYNRQCVRTYRRLPGADAVPRVKPVVAHDPLADAVAQAQHVCAIYAHLFGGRHAN